MNRLVNNILFLFIGCLFLSVNQAIAQALPADLTITADQRLEGTARSTLANIFFDINSSKLKSSITVESGESANLRGMENRSVALLEVQLTANYNGKEVLSDPIQLKAAGSSIQGAESKALRTLSRAQAFKDWLEKVKAMLPEGSESSCAAVTLLEGVQLPEDGKDAAALVRYVSSFRQNKGCDDQANALLENLSNQYADRQCNTLDALEIEVAAASYNRALAVQQLKRIRPEGPCWTRALGIAEKIGDDTRASLSARTSDTWINWFVRERVLR